MSVAHIFSPLIEQILRPDLLVWPKLRIQLLMMLQNVTNVLSMVENDCGLLFFTKLNLNFLYLAVFIDVSFAEIRIFHPKLGHVILLSYVHGNDNVLHYSTFKPKQNIESALAANPFALSHAFNLKSTAKVSLIRLC